MPLHALRHIAVEGPIGVGKTTLARRLATHLNASLLLEAPEANPYLERFYEDAGNWAFRTQVAFLMHRADQVKVLADTDASQPQRWVSDFLFAKDSIFAGLTLGEDDYRAYRRLHDPLAEQVPEPDIVIWLQAPVSVLLQRIRDRGIPMEAAISADYLQRLSAAYANHFAAYRKAPVVPVDNERYDAEHRAGDFDAILDRLGRVLAARGPT